MHSAFRLWLVTVFMVIMIVLGSNCGQNEALLDNETISLVELGTGGVVTIPDDFAGGAVAISFFSPG